MLEHLTTLKQKIISASLENSGNRIAILIKTINRKQLLFTTIESIFDYADVPFRLYVGDDGRIDEEQDEIYRLLRKSGHFIRVYERPIAITTAFNDLVRATEGERFILRMDDDFAFCPETKIATLRKILQLVPSLGAISGAEREVSFSTRDQKGKLSKKQGFLIRDAETLYRLNVPSDHIFYTVVDGLRFAVVGHSRNFLLLRREVLERVHWNEDLISFGEHIEFFMRLARAGWLLGFSPDSIHIHIEDGIPTRDYTGRAEGFAIEAKKNVLWQNYGIAEIKGISFVQSAKLRETSGGPGNLKRNLVRSLTRLIGFR
jgi:glycosyltransferase involved in cell wall biosynthesis